MGAGAGAWPDDGGAGLPDLNTRDIRLRVAARWVREESIDCFSVINSIKSYLRYTFLIVEAWPLQSL